MVWYGEVIFMSESPEEILEILNELEFEARLAEADYIDSLDPSTNVISIAPGSPARMMWEARMKLIHFVVVHKELGMELSE